MKPTPTMRNTRFRWAPARTGWIREQISAWYALVIILSLATTSPIAQGQVQLRVSLPADGVGALVQWEWDEDDANLSNLFQLESSSDLKTWSRLTSVDLRQGNRDVAPSEFLDRDASPVTFYRLVRGGLVVASATAAGGAELYGFAEKFQTALSELGELSVDEFVARYGRDGDYVDELSYDPTNAEFWDTLATPPGTPEPNVPVPNPQDVRLDDFGLNEEETEAFRKNGFVVSGRKGDHSFTSSYYKIFTNDLPVFISLDSVLHAWHQNFMKMLSEQEEFILSSEFSGIITSMRDQLNTIAALAPEALNDSLNDADYFLTVALSLFRGQQVSSVFGQSDSLVAETLADIDAGGIGPLPLFGRTNPEHFDFSQFKPRGHYTRSLTLQRYFRAAIWTGRVDFRIAGPKQFASERELATAIILEQAMQAAGKLEAWKQFDQVIQTFVGLIDSMTVEQLSGIMTAGGIKSVADIESLGQHRTLQQRIEEGDLGAQAILSHGFFASPSGASLSLPRSFTLFGQRFVMDSWAMGQMVFDKIFWNGAKVQRRLPSGVDIAFTVFGNRSATDVLAGRIQDPAGVPFRDGAPIQHHLGALAEVFDAVPTANWQDNIYTSWLHALRLWSQPLDDSIPEVFRTREWSRKVMSSQLASWTELRHNTVLYVKQSATPDVLCSFPYSYVEPNLPVWKAIAGMAQRTADQISQFESSGSAPIAPTLPSWIDPADFPGVPLEVLANVFGGQADSVSHQEILDKQVESLRYFQRTCETLAGIVEKQNAEKPFTNDQEVFLQNMVEIFVDYVGERTYSGWYPALYYFDIHTTGDPHPSDIWDPVVTDVHTNFPGSAVGDPGTILHEGVGNTAMMVVSVKCQGTRVYTGPVFTYYEFTSGPGVFERMTDEEWKRDLLNNKQPDEPEWTNGHRFPGSIIVPPWARED